MTHEARQTLDVNQIMELIPHRYPLLLIDRVVDIVANESATGIKNVTINENFFQGHFPGHPIMPGVLVVEAMAQTCAALVAESDKANKGKLVYFTSIEEAKFRKPVVPGDVVHLKVQKLQNRKSLWKFDCKAYVDDKVVTEAVISAMIMQ
ncbi:MAG TPA: 3-hydroxyacyl-[acyl-carrier-protein] dehydratase FabZ [Alphaproteobacteria bacterium]|nr:3-hydroxyacyl-[acyl-carrier-protein] dehydratase FabZ [Alphaproteobacteria bacterium]